MRIVLLAVAVLAAVSVAQAEGLRQPPAPDDLFDPDLIDLDLGAIIAEKEKLWSVTFGLGTSGQGLRTTEAQARNIVTIKEAFDNLADAFEEAVGIDIRWSKDSFEDMRPVLDIYGGGRLKLPSSVTLPGLGGRFGLELDGGRTGSATRFSEYGFGASIADEAWYLSGRALYYLPSALTLPGLYVRGVEKREIYIAAGFGRAWAKHSVEIFSPDPVLQGIGDFYLYEATGSANTFDLSIGAEEYFTPFLSVSLRAGYRWLEKGSLKYTDVEEIRSSPLLINEGEIATVWGPWFPEGMVPIVAMAAGLEYGWDRGEEPIVVDFSGFLFRAGLRYHF
ncbi:MAG: hypothetical protein FJY73_13360 [Candidatus Eisenbacteria bacterium]|nr:hypothetical protein [Candidatus Eisenbacteria bacterium]